MRDDEIATTADRLHSAAIHILRRVRRQDEATGLSPARLSALSVLVFGGPCSLGELAAAEHVTPATMSRLVSALERDGLVRRRPDPSDGRAVRLEATLVAERTLRDARRRRVAALSELLAGLTADERAQVSGAVAALERALRPSG